jgi:hypothetical protein
MIKYILKIVFKFFKWLRNICYVYSNQLLCLHDFVLIDKNRLNILNKYGKITGRRTTEIKQCLKCNKLVLIENEIVIFDY